MELPPGKKIGKVGQRSRNGMTKKLHPQYYRRTGGRGGKKLKNHFFFEKRRKKDKKTTATECGKSN